MAYSMTGYGRAVADAQGRALCVEIRTVNHRYLDVRVRMPAGLLALEDEVRRLVGRRLHRGRVECTVSFEGGETSGRRMFVDEALLHNVAAGLQRIKEVLGIDEPLRLADVAAIPELWTIETDPIDEDAAAEALQRAVAEALDGVVRMRRAEGEALMEDILPRVRRVEALVDELDRQSPAIAAEQQRRLVERVTQLLAEHPVDVARIAQEAAILADRIDVSEEIARIRSHLNQFKSAMATSGPVGRTLDFLLQELNREWNTVGSKTPDAQAALVVVQARAEIEKMREQVQNVE